MLLTYNIGFIEDLINKAADDGLYEHTVSEYSELAKSKNLKVRVSLLNKILVQDPIMNVYSLKIDPIEEEESVGNIYRIPTLGRNAILKNKTVHFSQLQSLLRNFDTLESKDDSVFNGSKFSGVGGTSFSTSPESAKKYNQLEKERKILKELKMSISQKKTPNMIRNMAGTTITLLFMMFIIIVSDFVNKTYQNAKLKRSVRINLVIFPRIYQKRLDVHNFS